ncbi:MAG: SGNH/GDSL hydrolase family protein [Lachnospiraceae bacterium]|nr:SGNH/GDSL hydrolase family protein [Lachnospiraceae bacterium]
MAAKKNGKKKKNSISLVIILTLAGILMCAVLVMVFVEFFRMTNNDGPSGIHAESETTTAAPETEAEPASPDTKALTPGETDPTAEPSTKTFGLETALVTEMPIIEPDPVKLTARVNSDVYLLGYTLKASDFTIEVEMSDGSTLKNPDGWNVSKLYLDRFENEIVIAYANLSTVINVKAIRPQPVLTQFVFLGDSRFVGIDNLTSDPSDKFYAKVGAGYTYLESVKEQVIRAGTTGSALIIGLGVNDSGYNAARYAATINDIAARYPGKVFFTTVNPVNEEQAAKNNYIVSNEKIAQFNASVRAGLAPNVYVIDTNAYLTNVGCSWRDGLHFADITSITVYNYIRQTVTKLFG